MSDFVQRNRKEARASYYRARADNIKKQVSVYDVLSYYQIPIRTEDYEIQYPCPLHGDGRDMGYSARAYPEDDGNGNLGGSTYCWGCQKARDVIQWVMDKETVSFTEAMRLLEVTFEVKDVPNIYKYFDPGQPLSEGREQGNKEQAPNKLLQDLSEILEGVGDRSKVPKERGEKSKESLLTYARLLERKIDRTVSREAGKRSISLGSLLRIYYVLDSTTFDLTHQNIEPEKASKVLKRLSSKVDRILLS